jgi:hypothetical protein
VQVTRLMAWSWEPTSLSHFVDSSRTPAPKTAGRDRRKENRAAVERLMPRNRAAVIVTPEREAPGMRASTWASPTRRASRQVNCSSSFSGCWACWRRRTQHSAHTSTRASPMAEAEMTYSERRVVSMSCLKRSPKTTTGMVPRIINHPSRPSRVEPTVRGVNSVKKARTICQMSRWK